MSRLITRPARFERRKATRKEVRKIEQREFTGVTCLACGSYAHLAKVKGQVQVICNADNSHRK